MSEQHQSRFFFKVVLRETCSMLRNVVFPVSAPPNAALQSQADFFLFCFAIFFFLQSYLGWITQVVRHSMT